MSFAFFVPVWLLVTLGHIVGSVFCLCILLWLWYSQSTYIALFVPGREGVPSSKSIVGGMFINSLIWELVLVLYTLLGLVVAIMFLWELAREVIRDCRLVLNSWRGR